MAEVTAMRNNALPYPVYGVTFTITFPMLDADGDLVTGATTPDAERSLNGDTFADCTNESTEIATNSGVYYLTLTAAEMTADIVTVIAKSATAGMKTTVMTLYPRKLVVVRTGTCQGSNDTGDIQFDASASAVDDYYNGCLCVAVIDSTTEARIINDYVGSTKVGEVSPAWNTAQPDNNDTFTIYAVPENSGVGMSDVNSVLAVLGTPADTDLATDIVNLDGKIGTPANLGGGGATIEGMITDAYGASQSGTQQIVTILTALMLTNGAIGDTGNDTTHIHLPAFTYGDDEINDMLLVILDDSESEYHVRWISDWVNATKLATVATLPFTPQNDVDAYWLLPTRRDVTAASIAAGAITAAAIATDAIDADALATDAITEIWAKAMSDLAAVPAANASVLAGINWMFELARNKLTQTATTGTIFKDDASTSLATTTVSDDLTTFTRGEWA